MDLLHRLNRGIRRRLELRRRVASVAESHTASQKRQLLEDTSLSSRDRELLEHASSSIHIADDMYQGDLSRYYGAALSAVRCMEEALQAAGLSHPRTILDLPCGYGRVQRILVRRFPEARITACELTREAVDFCVKNFGAEPFYSVPDFDAVKFPGRFNLIWSGSLVTHLDSSTNVGLLQLFSRSLADDGVVVVTTHGDHVAGHLPTEVARYGLVPEQAAPAVAAYKRDGFAYVDYPGVKGYGVSLTSPAWMREQARLCGMREVFFKPRGWHELQDVYGFVRAKDAAASSSPSASPRR